VAPAIFLRPMEPSVAKVVDMITRGVGASGPGAGR